MIDSTRLTIDNYVSSVEGITPALLRRIARDARNKPLTRKERVQLDREIYRMKRELRLRRRAVELREGFLIVSETPTLPED